MSALVLAMDRGEAALASLRLSPHRCGIAQELDGPVVLEFDLEFDAASLQCRIRLPLSDRVSIS
jgi:hypothetical protein